MRILLLNQWFEPEPTVKGLTFARELVRRGHEVQVLTGFPNYPGGTVYPGYRIRPWEREVVDGIPVLRVSLYPSHDRSGVRRLLNYGSFALSASVLGAALVRAPDVVYAYHPPGSIGLPAMILRLFRRVPLVLDINDLWPDSLSSTGMISNEVVLKLVDLWCRGMYRSASKIVITAPGFREALIERGVPEKKLELIYNWCDEESIYPRDRNPELARELGLTEDRLIVMFAGTMGLAQALDSVLQSARLCAATDPTVQFVFVGGGVEKERLQQKAAALQLPNVRFLPAQPMQRMGEILALADILLVHLRDDPLFHITIPSKTQAYLAAGRPIVMGMRGDAADLIREARAGVVCEPEDAETIARAISSLARLSAAERDDLGRAGREYYCRHLSLSAGVDKFERAFQSARR